MGRDIIKAKIDIIFKKLFTDDADSNELLKGLLRAILELDDSETLDDIQITKNEIMPNSESGKVSRLDLNIKVNNKLINVEIQLAQHKDYADRALLYWARLFANSLKKGERYSNLPQTISLNVLGYTMFEDIEDYHTKNMIMDVKNHNILTDKLSIQFFELTKLRKKEKDLTNRKERWLRFLDAETEEELDMLEKVQDNTLNKAISKLRYFNADEQMRFDAITREKAINDERALIAEGKAEGRAEGRAEGIAIGEERGLIKGKAAGRAEGIAIGVARREAEIISKMRKKGYSDEMIADILNA